MKGIFTPLAYSASMAAMIAAVPAWAQDGDASDDEIIVTADLFEKTVQDTPIALTVIDGETIAEEGRTKIDDVLKNEPGVIVQGAARGFLVSIRGLGLSLPPQMGQGAVSTNYDGAFSNRAESASAGFYDLERVEVLRGPQSTLYGRNSVGGVVNIISANPVLGQVEGYATGEVGNYNLFHGEGAINLPLGDTMALRLSGSGVTRDGYISNGHDDNEAFAARAKLLFAPSDGFDALLGVEFAGLRGKGPGAVPIASVDAGTRITTDVGFGYQHTDSIKLWADINADIGPGTLHILPAWQEVEGTTLGAFGGNFNYAADPLLNRQQSIELRYSSQAGSDIDWSLGFYHYNARNEMQTIAGSCQDVAGNFVVPAPGFNSVPPGPPGPAPLGGCIAADLAPAASYEVELRTSRTTGIFGQLTVPVSDSLRLIAGARYSWERIGGANDDNADFTGPLPTLTDSHFDYRLGLEFDLGEDVLLYATTATGYRQGGFGFSQVVPTYAAQPYDPEEMTSYELGLKSSLMDGSLILNLTGFYYDYEAFQLVIADFSNFPPAFSVPVMPASELGIEAQAVLSFGEGGRLDTSLVYLDSELDGINGFYVGLPFPNTPELTLKAGLEYALELDGVTVTPRGDIRLVGQHMVFPEAFAVPDTHPSVQQAYTMADLSVKFAFENDITVLAYVKNVTDEIVKQSHFFGYSQLQAPRTYGLTGTVRF